MFTDDGKLIVHQQHDISGQMRRVEAMREVNVAPLAESVCLGSVPAVIVNEWLKEAGVTWDDTEAAREVLMRKLRDGDWAKFRVYEGRF